MSSTKLRKSLSRIFSPKRAPVTPVAPRTPRTPRAPRPTDKDVARRLLSPPRRRSPRRKRRSRSPPVDAHEYAYWRNKRKPPGPSPLSTASQRLVVFDPFGHVETDTTMHVAFGTFLVDALRARRLPPRTRYHLVENRAKRDVLPTDQVSNQTIVLAVPPGARLP